METGEWHSSGYNFSDSTITSITKQVGTNGAFGYNVSFTVPAEGNSTGYDLKITAIANVTVFEEIENNTKKRVPHPSNNGRVTVPESKKVAKAVMKSTN
jgi:hypothetical protein